MTPDALPWTDLGGDPSLLARITVDAAPRGDRWYWLAMVDDDIDRAIHSGGTMATEAEALAAGAAWLEAARGAHGGDCDGGGE